MTSIELTRKFPQLPQPFAPLVRCVLASCGLKGAILLLTMNPVLLAQQTATVSNAQPESPADLPSGKEIYEQYLTATGGREKLDSIQGMLMRGHLEIQSFKAPITIKRARPGVFSLKIEFPGLGAMDQGTNGELAWDVSPMQGQRLLDGEEREEMLKRADFDEETNPDKYYQSIECTGTETIHDSPCYVVEFTDHKGSVERRWYDQNTHLLLSSKSARKGVVGDITTVSDDYRDVNGLKMAFRQEIKAMGVTQILKLDEVVLNPEFGPDEFAPPESVAKMIQKKKQREAKQSNASE